MKKFLAKSSGETVTEHTEKLIENFNLLFQIYPNIKVDKKLLFLACVYHDLGKINIKFQYKVSNKEQKKIIEKENRDSLKGSEIPHGVLSTAFINDDTLLDKYLFDENDIKILGYAVALHHERNLSEITEDEFEDEVESMNFQAEDFLEGLKKLEKTYENYLKETGKFEIDKEFENESIFWIDNNKIEIQKPSVSCFDIENSRIYSESAGLSKEESFEIFGKYIMVKGLLNKIDYAASSDTVIEEKNNFLEAEMESFLKKVLQKDNPNNDWNELQKFMLKNRDENVVVVAQTGYGKTEAGLLWIGNNKGFFTLPLRVAINSIYERIRRDIVEDEIEKKVGLLHSDFREIYLKNEEEKSGK